MKDFFILFIKIFSEIVSLSILARILMSWFQSATKGPIFDFLISITEPILEPIRRALPRAGMIDFSPIIAILAIGFIESLSIQLITSL